jgi:hypothetical protein
MVELRLESGKVLDVKVITDTEGGFKLVGVPEGDYTIILNKIGYIPRPNESKKLRVKDKENAGELWLIKAYGTASYYSVVATEIVNRVSMAGTDANKRRVYTDEWKRLRVVGLPPSSKALGGGA